MTLMGLDQWLHSTMERVVSVTLKVVLTSRSSQSYARAFAHLNKHKVPSFTTGIRSHLSRHSPAMRGTIQNSMP